MIISVMKKSIFIVAVLLLASVIEAQTISVPWQCGFEDAVENKNWKFVSPTSSSPLDTLDAWTIGRAIRSQGKQSMYISIDGGTTATFGHRSDIAMSYRLIQFPKLNEAKEYDISFDFCLQGDTVGTQLYVFFDYASKLITGTDQYQLLQYVNANKPLKTIPDKVLAGARYVYSGNYTRTNVLKNQKNWRNVSIDAGKGTDYSERIKANETNTFALVFVWVNKNTDAKAQAKGACVDNIQIASATMQKPQNVTYTTLCADSSITLLWDGVLSDYMIQYKRSSSTTWRKISYTGNDGQTHHSRTITALRDGTYDFSLVGVQSVWDEAKGKVVSDTSAQASLYNVLLYCPENQCVNFIDLDAADCSFGENGQISGSSAIHQKVDYGAEDVLSFHTVITDQSLYDIRTNYQVKEIPEGAMASVRLGNWYSPGDNLSNNPVAKQCKEQGLLNAVNGQAITYDYVVDTTEAAILLLQYAIVFEQTNHDRREQPYFKLTVLDENGVQLGTCGKQQFDCPFASDENPDEQKRRVEEEHWKFYPKEDQPARNADLGFKGDTIWYKDWTSMGLNLSAYHGKKLKINIESRGCGMSAHYGYGYFALSCASATLETDQCGTDSQAAVEAPEGFNYQWYAEQDEAKFKSGDFSVVRSTDRVFTAKKGSDTVYVCHLSYIDAEDCGFDLRTSLSPRGVRPGFSSDLQWDKEQWPCSTMVVLKDTSRIIYYKDDGTMQVTSSQGDYSNWKVRSLSDPNKAVSEYSGDQITHLVDLYGDTLEISQESFIGACSQVLLDTIVVPSILTPDSVVHDSVCSNHKYVFDGQVFDGRYFPASDTFYTATYTNQYGCDSTLTLYLRLDSATVYEVRDTVSRDQLPLIFHVLQHGDTLRTYEVGNYYDSVTTDFYVLKLINRFDCDSMVNLRLTIIPALKVSVGETGDLCGRKSFDLSYSITQGDYDSLLIRYNEVASSYGMRDTVVRHDPYNHPLPVQQYWTLPVAIPEGTAPDHYYADLTFYQYPKLFQPQTYRVEIDIKYDTAIIRQKWNDVLSLVNEKLNGGYTFTSYQWYENNTPIEGQTRSYLYMPSGLKLDGTTYKALITRTDGVEQFTCNFYPTDRSSKQISEYPTLVQAGQMVPMRVEGSAHMAFRSMLGATYSVVTITGEGVVTAPSVPGWYVLCVQMENDVEYNQKVLVTP